MKTKNIYDQAEDRRKRLLLKLSSDWKMIADILKAKEKTPFYVNRFLGAVIEILDHIIIHNSNPITVSLLDYQGLHIKNTYPFGRDALEDIFLRGVYNSENTKSLRFGLEHFINFVDEYQKFIGDVYNKLNNNVIRSSLLLIGYTEYCLTPPQTDFLKLQIKTQMIRYGLYLYTVEERKAQFAKPLSLTLEKINRYFRVVPNIMYIRLIYLGGLKELKFIPTAIIKTISGYLALTSINLIINEKKNFDIKKNILERQQEYMLDWNRFRQNILPNSLEDLEELKFFPIVIIKLICEYLNLITSNKIQTLIKMNSQIFNSQCPRDSFFISMLKSFGQSVALLKSIESQIPLIIYDVISENKIDKLVETYCYNPIQSLANWINNTEAELPLFKSFKDWRIREPSVTMQTQVLVQQFIIGMCELVETHVPFELPVKIAEAINKKLTSAFAFKEIDDFEQALNKYLEEKTGEPQAVDLVTVNNEELVTLYVKNSAKRAIGLMFNSSTNFCPLTTQESLIQQSSLPI